MKIFHWININSSTNGSSFQRIQGQPKCQLGHPLSPLHLIFICDASILLMRSMHPRNYPIPNVSKDGGCAQAPTPPELTTNPQVLWKWGKTSFKLEWGAPQGALSRTCGSPPPADPAGRNRLLILTREDAFHVGNLSPAFKKKKEECSLSQQERTSHRPQPVRKPHDLELCPSEMTFRPNNLLQISS